MAQQHTPTARHRADAIDVVEITGQDAEDLMASDFGALALVPIERDRFEDKLRRAFNLMAREEKRGLA